MNTIVQFVKRHWFKTAWFALLAAIAALVAAGSPYMQRYVAHFSDIRWENWHLAVGIILISWVMYSTQTTWWITNFTGRITDIHIWSDKDRIITPGERRKIKLLQVGNRLLTGLAAWLLWLILSILGTGTIRLPEPVWTHVFWFAVIAVHVVGLPLQHSKKFLLAGLFEFLDDIASIFIIFSTIAGLVVAGGFLAGSIFRQESPRQVTWIVQEQLQVTQRKLLYARTSNSTQCSAMVEGNLYTMQTQYDSVPFFDEQNNEIGRVNAGQLFIFEMALEGPNGSLDVIVMELLDGSEQEGYVLAEQTYCSPMKYAEWPDW